MFIRFVYSPKCSCLALCLRSTHTGDNVDYVVEFLWPRGRNFSIVLESLLLNLKRCLPSFKFASGRELGCDFNIKEQGKVKEEDDLRQKYQGTMKEAATNLVQYIICILFLI